MASYVSGREPSSLGPIVILVSLVFAIGGAGAWFMSTMEDNADKDMSTKASSNKHHVQQLSESNMLPSS